MNDMEQKKIFAKNLNRLLHETGKSQIEVANAIHVLPTTFNTWCRGNALPRMGKVQLLADYFQISKTDLIDERGEEAPAPPTPTTLTTDEQGLIEDYRELNEEGKMVLRTTARGMAAGGAYAPKVEESVGAAS